MSIFHERRAHRANDVLRWPFKITGLTRFLGGILILAALSAPVQAEQSVTLAWNPSSDPTVGGCNIYYGVASRTYTNKVNVGNVTSATISGLVEATTYYFAATAYNTLGLESDYSDESSYTVPVFDNLPIIALTAPSNGAGYTAPATINLAANVTANGHSITKVQFYNGATLLGEAPSAPYSFIWSNVSAGSYSLTARAVYDAGSTVDSTPANVTVNASGTIHYDFTYRDQASLLAGGWDFLARTPSGTTRNTEQTSGMVVDYDQMAHPGVLRIPADAGDLWASMNDTRNTLFRNLPANWTSLRLKLSFAPTQNYQQASIVAYQDDDNYVQVTREYNDGDKVSLVQEIGGSPDGLQSASVSATTNLHLRLDQDVATGMLSAYYSLTGTNWVALGSVTQALNGPRVGIVVGSSPGGYPNADLAWVEVMAPQTAPVLTVSPGNLTFSVVQGTSPASQSIGITNSGSGTLNWTAVADGTAPAWLTVSPANGVGNGTISVSVASASLAPGVYSKSITVTAVGATNSPQTVSVNLTVTNPPPAVALTAPLDGASYTAPATINLAASVTANGHSITTMQFYNGTNLLGETISAPYSCTWSNVSADSYSLTARAVYDAGSTVDSSPVSIAVTGLPAPWQTADIDSVGAVGGSASVSNGLYIVKGAGNLSGTADNFRFVYQPLSGDGEIKVRLNSVENTGTSGRIGVMIRESLTSGSEYAFMGILPDGTFRWQHRSRTGGWTWSTTSTIGTPPNVWTRLVRTGNMLYGYESTDGTNWTQVNSRSIWMATDIYVGLAVASGSSNTLNTATFTDMTVVP
jgi:regulation of enolase protein 1 (concanavalin A-like superfamily)